MITLYNEKNEKIKLISTFEFNDADMGESSISATVSFDKEQDFHPDWYVVYNGEKFRLGVRKPTGKKDTSSLQTSYTLVFKSEREDLKRYTFMDFVELGGGNPQPSSYNVSLYTTLSEFVYRFNTNLRYYMGSRWKMVLPDGYVEDGNAVSVAFENASLWDVLLRFYEIHGVRWVIRGVSDVMQIRVGFQEVEIEHIFEYGKGNGLVSVERNNALERIITRLRGRGSEKNLPPDYFHTGDPDTNSFLQATFFKNLMPKSYRDYIRGYNAGSGTGSWAYNQGVADRVSGRDISPVDYAISDKEDLWGVSYGAIEPNEQIFPTLQGATRNGVRLDEVLSVEQVLVDGVREPQNTITVGIGPDGQKSSSGKCGDGSKNNYLEDCRDGIKFTIFTDRFQVTNPINASQVRITLVPSYINSEGLPVPVEFGSASTVRSSAELQLVDFTGSATGKVIRTQTISDTDSYLWELDNIPAGDYCFRTNVAWSADIQSEGYGSTSGDVVVNVDTRLTEATVKEYARASAKSEFKETFDIEIRDVWGVTRNAGESDEDYTYRVWAPRAVSEDMAVMFSDGLLAGEDYEFRIVGFNSDADNLRQTITSAIKPTNNGGWKLTLQKSDAELDAGNIYLPNTMQNAKAGDHFFFVNIAMPYDPYVYDAEERLLSYLDEQLAMKDEEYPSFTITPSKIFCSSFTEADKIQAGAKIRVRNTALVGESYISLYIQSLTKRYSATSLNPEWNLTISDQVVVSGNPVETLQGEVNVLAQRVYSNRSAIQEAVRSLSSTFLRKDGIADTSYSPIEFKKPVKLGEGISDRDFINGDISGKGFGIYTDGEGNRVIEADILVGRVGARFNEVVINQATYSAGKQVFSSAGMVVSRVEDAGTSWRCYFDTKNATVRNYFVVNDGAFCQRFVDSGIRQYWARVTSVGPDYIDISKTDRMEGSFNPIVGDNIAQLGNSADRSRQAALIIDETREGGGLVTWYDDITDFTLYDKNSVNIGRIAEVIEVEGVSNTIYKTWLQVYGSAFIGNRDKSQFVEFDNNTLKLKGRLEIGSTISDAMTVVEDGLIQSTLLKLGYYKDDIFKIMSGTNGLYDENVLGGGIAAWYGGPMADKEADSSLIEYAQSLFRFDGSGYLAGGNITWDKDGAGSVAGGDIKWDKDGAITLGVGIKISGDANETLGSILSLVNKIASWFGEDEDTGAIYVKKKSGEARDFYTYGAISFGGLGESSGSTGGGGITTFDVFVGNNGPYSLQDGKVKLPAYPVMPTDYASVGWVEDNFTPVDAHNTLSQRVTALENSGTGGGSGGTTSVVSYNASVLSGKLLGTLTINEIENKIYAPEIPTKLSAFTNDVDFAKVSDIPSLEGYATLDDIPTIPTALKNPYALVINGTSYDGSSKKTITITAESLGALTEHQSLAHLLSKTEAAKTYQPQGDYATKGTTLSHYGITDALGINETAADSKKLGGNTADAYARFSGEILNGDFKHIGYSYSRNIDHTGPVISFGASASYYAQIAAEGGFLYFRQYYEDHWYNDGWKQLAFTTSNVASATKLKTARTIWGQSFDGTANVSGALSGVTSINATSGNVLIGADDSDYSEKFQVHSSSFAVLRVHRIGNSKSYGSAITFSTDYANLGVMGWNQPNEFKIQDAESNKLFYGGINGIFVNAPFNVLENTTFSKDVIIGTIPLSQKTQNSKNYLEIDGDLVVTGAISFGGFGEGGSTSGGITSVTKEMVINALEYTPYNAASFTKANIKSTLGISDWALAASKPTYTKSDVGLGNVTNLAASGYLTDLSSNSTNAVSITVGGTTKNISASTLKTSMGLGSLAYKDSLSFSELTGKPNTLSGYGIIDSIKYANHNSAGYVGASVDSARHSIGYDNSGQGSKNLPYAGGFVSADEGRYGFQLLGDINGSKLSFRGINNNTLSAWVEVYHTGNFNPSDFVDKTSADSTFLKLSGGTIAGTLIIKRTSNLPSLIRYENTSGTLGFLGFENANTPVVYTGDLSHYYTLIHSGNIGSQSVENADQLDGYHYSDVLDNTLKYGYKNATLNATGWYRIAKLTGYGSYMLSISGSYYHTNSTSASFIINKSYTKVKVSQIGAASVADMVSSVRVVKDASTSSIMYVEVYMKSSYSGEPFAYKISPLRDGATDDNYRIEMLDATATTDSLEELAKVNIIVNADVYSASKLATSRTIWGQSFDGTANVSGALSGVTSINASGGNVLIGTTTDSGAKLQVNGGVHSLTGSSYLYGYGTSSATSLSALDNVTAIGAGKGSWNIYMWSFGNGNGGIQASNSNDVTRYNLLLQPFGGNVGIGTTNPSSKLHVAGDVTLSDTTGSSAKSYKLKFQRGTNADDYWDYGIYAQTTKGLTFYQSANNVDTDIAYLTGDGNFVVSGSITFGSASDRRLKDNIKSMTDKQALAVLSALNPVTFNWNSTAYELGKLSGISDGFIADEYEKLIPNSGRDIWANYRAINYERATGYLVKGWQNHETRLEKAERRIKELENELKQYRYGTV